MRGRRKPSEPQEEGSPAWMNTYGDMVTLLLTFFVLLFSFSTIDAAKWEEIVNSFAGMPHLVAITELDPNMPDSPDRSDRFVITSPEPAETPSPSPAPPEQANLNVIELKERFDELYERIKNYIESNDLGYILNVEYIDENTILVRMSDSAFFDSGSAHLDDDAKIVLDVVCGMIEEYTSLLRTIRIEGHTDNVPIRNVMYEDNWELSMDRSDTVRKFILGVSEIDPGLLVASYYGEYRPVATNDTAEGRAQNRRVDFIIESVLKN
mgnify:CR=1 FL=1